MYKTYKNIALKILRTVKNYINILDNNNNLR